MTDWNRLADLPQKCADISCWAVPWDSGNDLIAVVEGSVLHYCSETKKWSEIGKIEIKRKDRQPELYHSINLSEEDSKAMKIAVLSCRDDDKWECHDFQATLVNISKEEKEDTVTASVNNIEWLQKDGGIFVASAKSVAIERGQVGVVMHWTGKKNRISVINFRLSGIVTHTFDKKHSFDFDFCNHGFIKLNDDDDEEEDKDDDDNKEEADEYLIFRDNKMQKLTFSNEKIKFSEIKSNFDEEIGLTKFRCFSYMKYGKYVVVCGGYTGDKPVSRMIYYFDTEKNIWRASDVKCPVAFKTFNSTNVCVNGNNEVVILGGHDGKTMLNQHYSIAMPTVMWSALPSLPEASSEVSCMPAQWSGLDYIAVVKDKIFAYRGVFKKWKPLKELEHENDWYHAIDVTKERHKEKKVSKICIVSCKSDNEWECKGFKATMAEVFIERGTHQVKCKLKQISWLENNGDIFVDSAKSVCTSEGEVLIMHRTKQKNHISRIDFKNKNINSVIIDEEGMVTDVDEKEDDSKETKNSIGFCNHGLVHLDGDEYLIFRGDLMSKMTYNRKKCDFSFSRIENNFRREIGYKTWSRFSYMKHGRHVVVIGGGNDSETRSDAICVYDTMNNTWHRSLLSCPYGFRTFNNNLFLNKRGEVHLVGGDDGSGGAMKHHFSVNISRILKFRQAKKLQIASDLEEWLKKNDVLEVLPCLKKYSLCKLSHLRHIKSESDFKELFKDSKVSFKTRIKFTQHVMNLSSEDEVLRLKQPYIIILGITKYEGDNDRYPDLPASATAVRELTGMFRDEYKYSHVYSCCDELIYGGDRHEGVEYEHIRSFLNYHFENIKKHKEEIDGLLFYYTGHGVSDGILPSDVVTCGMAYAYSHIFEIFDNSRCTSLAGKPKVYCLDCCKGPNVLRIAPTQQLLGMNIDTGREVVIATHGDEVRWFGTLDNYRAFQGIAIEESTIFGKALFNEFSRNVRLKKCDLTISQMAANVAREVQDSESQICEYISRLTYQLKFDKAHQN